MSGKVVFSCILLVSRVISQYVGTWFPQTDSSVLPQTALLAFSITGTIPENPPGNIAGKMYAFGGCTDINTCNINEIQLYRAQFPRWEYPNSNSLNNPQQIYGIGQIFTTLNEIIYFNINGNIGSYDMRNEIYNYPFKSLSLNNIIEACATSYNNNLYFIGGINTGNNNIESNEFQIYNILGDMWNTNTPKLNTARYYSTCNTLRDTIYIVGGSSTTTNAFNSIEYININLLNEWQILSSTMTIARAKHRTIIHGNLIVIIGGADNNGNPLKDITVLDTVTNILIENSMTPLLNARIGPNVMYDGNRVYVYGGLDSNGNVYTHWEFTLTEWTQSPTSANPTHSPTSSPSNKPTTTPTKSPTAAPSITPTNSPSIAPSNTPTRGTLNPSKTPTELPTNDPTATPSENPTKSPTQPPTISPTIGPSISPSDSPTKPPTNAPSRLPTNSPNQSSGKEFTPGINDKGNLIDLLILLAAVIVGILFVFAIIAAICCYRCGKYRMRSDLARSEYMTSTTSPSTSIPMTPNMNLTNDKRVTINGSMDNNNSNDAIIITQVEGVSKTNNCVSDDDNSKSDDESMYVKDSDGDIVTTKGNNGNNMTTMG